MIESGELRTMLALSLFSALSSSLLVVPPPHSIYGGQTLLHTLCGWNEEHNEEDHAGKLVLSCAHHYYLSHTNIEKHLLGGPQ